MTPRTARVQAPPVDKISNVLTEAVVAGVQKDGYWVGYAPTGGDEVDAFLLTLARSLGDLYVPEDCNPAAPLIRTEPTRRRLAAPFDRPEGIGWHGDFASHPDRPELSLVYVICPDPAGGMAGAWRLASVSRVLSMLRQSLTGRRAIDLMSREPLPFCYADDQPPSWFLALEDRGESGLRFYKPSIVRGCVAAYGRVPRRIAAALSAVERAADDVAEVRTTDAGSLLVTSNWSALHDRVQQTVSRAKPNR
jgi:hypothetical protein